MHRKFSTVDDFNPINPLNDLDLDDSLRDLDEIEADVLLVEVEAPLGSLSDQDLSDIVETVEEGYIL